MWEGVERGGRCGCGVYMYVRVCGVMWRGETGVGCKCISVCVEVCETGVGCIIMYARVSVKVWRCCTGVGFIWVIF